MSIDRQKIDMYIYKIVGYIGSQEGALNRIFRFGVAGYVNKNFDTEFPFPPEGAKKRDDLLAIVREQATGTVTCSLQDLINDADKGLNLTEEFDIDTSRKVTLDYHPDYDPYNENIIDGKYKAKLTAEVQGKNTLEGVAKWRIEYIGDLLQNYNTTNQALNLVKKAMESKITELRNLKSRSEKGIKLMCDIYIAIYQKALKIPKE